MKATTEKAFEAYIQESMTPFNRGSNPGAITCGKGNPQYPSGHRTGYFREELLERESYHQLDAVRKLTSSAWQEKTGNNYLGVRGYVWY